MRRAARLLCVNKNTVTFLRPRLGAAARIQNERFLESRLHVSREEIQLDELETFEHTKMKPLSVPLAVDAQTREILGFQVCSMPAKGLLAARSRKKYGPRVDGRPRALNRLLTQLRPHTRPETLIRSDSNPNYPSRVRRLLPKLKHRMEISRRGCIVGQAELKKTGFDPLFSLNHTCAMLRANINRLARKTWCTTKRPEALADHIAIYVDFHNRALRLAPLTTR